MNKDETIDQIIRAICKAENDKACRVTVADGVISYINFFSDPFKLSWRIDRYRKKSVSGAGIRDLIFYLNKIYPDDLKNNEVNGFLEEVKAMKLCKDCKFYVNDIERNYCGRTKETKYDFISGRPINSFSMCETERTAIFDADRRCGPNAKYFEPKPDGFFSRVLKFLRCV